MERGWGSPGAQGPRDREQTQHLTACLQFCKGKDEKKEQDLRRETSGVGRWV